MVIGRLDRGFIIKIDKDRNWELKKGYWEEESEIWKGNADSNKIVKGFKNFLNKIAKDGKKFGVKNLDRKVALVVSSGASNANNTLKIIDALQDHGYNIVQVTSREEAKYGFLASRSK